MLTTTSVFSSAQEQEAHFAAMRQLAAEIHADSGLVEQYWTAHYERLAEDARIRDYLLLLCQRYTRDGLLRLRPERR